MLFAGSAQALPGPDAAWQTLDTNPVQIACTEIDGEPWCRSEGLIDADAEAIRQTLEHMDQHQELFESVLSIRTLELGLLHVTLDFPGMLSDRDYVARYAYDTDGAAHLYRWTPAQHPDAPAVDGVVRLERMAGEWRLEPEGSQTRVTYTWQAELAGTFPAFAINTARKKAGHEALKDLANAQGAKLIKRK